MPPGPSRTRLCTCRLYCRPYNAITGEYEGRGRRIPDSTCATHVNDERSANARQVLPHQLSMLQSIPSTEILPQGFLVPANPQKSLLLYSPNPILEVEQELDVLEAYAAPQKLEFISAPNSSSLPYRRPENISVPNRGEYALKSRSQVNSPFLWTEARLCSLLQLAMEVEDDRHRTRLQARIEEDIHVLHSYKAAEWDSQRLGEDGLSLRVNSGQIPPFI